MNAFNTFIEKHELREMHRGGQKFTWTNKQEQPIQSNTDRMLMTTDWEKKFPLSCLTTLTRIVLAVEYRGGCRGEEKQSVLL
jgi:hypothetical protein